MFEDSKTPLQKWFIAIFLLTSHKKSVSSLQLAKDIGVTQKTTWFMLQILKKAMETKHFSKPLSNIVEIGEIYIGGKEKSKHNNKEGGETQDRNTDTKMPVLGMIEREGNIKVMQVEDIKKQTVYKMIIDNIALGSKIMIDEFNVYKGLNIFYGHKAIKHKIG